jgi:hypothetical protein
MPSDEEVSVIDTAAARDRVREQALRSAAIVGATGGWQVRLKFGREELLLGVQRANRPRQWISLDRCVRYVKEELGVTSFDLLDATRHRPAPAARGVRKDAAERLRRAHAAAEHDAWFRAQVQDALDDSEPAAPDSEVRRRFAAKRAALRKRATAVA